MIWGRCSPPQPDPSFLRRIMVSWSTSVTHLIYMFAYSFFCWLSLIFQQFFIVLNIFVYRCVTWCCSAHHWAVWEESRDTGEVQKGTGERHTHTHTHIDLWSSVYVHFVSLSLCCNMSVLCISGSARSGSDNERSGHFGLFSRARCGRNQWSLPTGQSGQRSTDLILFWYNLNVNQELFSTFEHENQIKTFRIWQSHSHSDVTLLSLWLRFSLDR